MIRHLVDILTNIVKYVKYDPKPRTHMTVSRAIMRCSKALG